MSPPRRHSSSRKWPTNRASLHGQRPIVEATKIFETNPVTDNREGPFVDFVLSFAEHFLPDEIKALNPRAIQRALKMRKDNPEEDRGR